MTKRWDTPKHNRTMVIRSLLYLTLCNTWQIRTDSEKISWKPIMESFNLRRFNIFMGGFMLKYPITFYEIPSHSSQTKNSPVYGRKIWSKWKALKLTDKDKDIHSHKERNFQAIQKWQRKSNINSTNRTSFIKMKNFEFKK